MRRETTLMVKLCDEGDVAALEALQGKPVTVASDGQVSLADRQPDRGAAAGQTALVSVLISPLPLGRGNLLMQNDRLPGHRVPLLVGFALLGLTLLSGLASQFVAWRFGFHPALGEPWFGRIYAPWSWIVWQTQFHASGPRTFQMLHAGMGLFGAMAAAGALFHLSARSRKAERHEGIHGTAHWASEAEIEATGLLGGKGVYVGRLVRRQRAAALSAP